MRWTANGRAIRLSHSLMFLFFFVLFLIDICWWHSNVPLGNRKVDVLDIVRQVLCVVKSIRGRSSLSFFCIFKLYDAFFPQIPLGILSGPSPHIKRNIDLRKTAITLLLNFLVSIERVTILIMSWTSSEKQLVAFGASLNLPMEWVVFILVQRMSSETGDQNKNKDL